MTQDTDTYEEGPYLDNTSVIAGRPEGKSVETFILVFFLSFFLTNGNVGFLSLLRCCHPRQVNLRAMKQSIEYEPEVQASKY